MRGPRDVGGARAPLRRRLLIPWIAVLIAAPVPFVVPGASGSAAHGGPDASPATASPHDPIRHVVVIFKENHSYDNLYGTYCQAVSKYCKDVGNGIPPGTCVPLYPKNASSPCHVPQNLTRNQMLGGNLPHLWINSYNSWNNGSMNGFYLAEGGRNLTFGHYNGTTVPLMWDLAEQYALGDDFFSSAMSYSLPNHWFMVAAATPLSMAYSYGDFAKAHLHDYLNQANTTATVQDLLIHHPNVTWKYYDWNLGSYQYAINRDKGGPQSAFDLWNPMAARNESYNATFAPHFVNRTDFLSDAANGTLPNISWIIPPYADSDHPGQSLVNGEAWTASVIDAVEASPDWNSTAIFLTWDEYGGWYDHVAPTVINKLNYGFRVPLLVISPYTPEDRIVHENGTFDSILHFIELRFGLGCLGSLDCNATNLSGFFDFTQSPRAPMTFPVVPADARYPMPLQNLSARSPEWDPGDVSPSEWTSVFDLNANSTYVGPD